MPYDFDGFQKDQLDQPRSKAWDNWAKLAAIGDKVQGYIRDVFYRPAEGKYKAARGITLEQPDGTLVNVSIKRLDFELAKTNHLRMGDPLTVVLEELRPNRQKGFSDTKIYGYYGANLDENKSNKTVAELDKEDMALQSFSEEDEHADAAFNATTAMLGANGASALAAMPLPAAIAQGQSEAPDPAPGPDVAAA